MAKLAVFVTLTAVLFSTITAYQKECIIGPQYWCHSFQNAQDCGALRHCTDTVWQHDGKYAAVQSSTSCDWCQKILENAHKGIQHLANNENLIMTTMSHGCRLFPLSTLSNTCTDTMEKYGTTVASLMKAERYATVCQLMNMCIAQPDTTLAPQSESTTEKPMILGQNRCTWGPAYWCSSLSNSRECKSIEHCSTNVWSQQNIEQQPDDNICKYCQFTIEKLRTIVEEDKVLMSVEKWLSGSCSMLPTKDLIDDCVEMMSKYADEVLALVKAKIDPGVICHLSHMCKDATIKVKAATVEIHDVAKPMVNHQENDEVTNVPFDEESKMLCHVIVRATDELYTKQNRERVEVVKFLAADCQNLPNSQLVEKCEYLVYRYGTEIYAHVASKVDLSKVCDYLDNFVDNSNVQALAPVHCELCQFVLSTSKYMLDANFATDKVIAYIDEQVCNRLNENEKKICRNILAVEGVTLIDGIRAGTKSMLLCTRFQICVDQIFDETNTIPKEDIQSFIKNTLCDKMGNLKDACYAMMEKDSTRLLKTVVQDLEGDVICKLFGVCPKRLTFLDDLAINDDKNQCKRCIDDFTRRKHIAEKLVNHSAEFLHHLCGQLPEKDKCTQAVDDSIQELIDFVRAMDPQDICVQLKMCDSNDLKELTSTVFDPSTISLSHEIINHLKGEICTKLGALSALCNKTMDAHGPAILAEVSKEIDPKKACAAIGICPATSAFNNCNDKCDCCMSRMEIHEVQVATFLRSMIDSIRALCQHMPGASSCLQMTSNFDTNINKITSKFNARSACEMLTHCLTTPIEIETLAQCKVRIDSKQKFLRSSITQLNQNLKSLCEYVPWNKDCYSIIDRSTNDVEETLNQLNTETICTSKQSLADAICKKDNPFKQLCQQLVREDKDVPRLEAIFKSMFNQDGRVEKEICEFEQQRVNLDTCPISFKPVGTQDKCHECVQFYQAMKSNDLKTIELLRTGFLATCDWSLSKDYCNSWFNRICDRLKMKIDQLIPQTHCQLIQNCDNKQSKSNDECLFNGDKCKCCMSDLEIRQKRFRSVVDDMTASLSVSCTDDNCRSLVKSVQQNTLDQIDRIDAKTLCQRYGYCAPEYSSQTTLYRSAISNNPYQHIGSSLEALNLRFETSLKTDLCFQYGQLRPICEHIMASPNSRQYAYMYRAILQNNPKLFDDDLREQLSTSVNTDVCTACKNTAQSAKDFWINAVDAVRDLLIQACERCPVKDKCQDHYNKLYEAVKAYVNSIDADQFCQSLHFCSSRPLIQQLNGNNNNKGPQCDKCIQRLDERKQVLRQGIERMTNYLSTLCQRFELKQCQVFLQQLQDYSDTTINTWNTQDICTHIGFCSTTDKSVHTDEPSFDQYEKYLKDELETTICTQLGPFQAWCKQILNGNREQVLTVKINDNLRDLMQIGQLINENLLSASNQNQCANDRCQCCVDRINSKKDCLKSMAQQAFGVLIKSCDYCPAKDQCRQYWTDNQKQCLASIDTIDAKQICVQIGFCTVSSLCAKMGLFQGACEQVLAKYTQSLKENPELIDQHLPKTSVVVLPTDKDIKPVEDSKATCILCEYLMKILSSYIHSQSTEEEIQKSLDEVCQRMARTLEKQCTEFVDNYGAAIIATLVQESDLSKLCQKLNICTKQMSVHVEHLTKANVASCGVCDYVSTYVHFALKRDPSDASLQRALDSVCNHLSSEQSSQCQTLVQLFGTRIRDLQLSLGKSFCQDLTMCQTPKDEPSPLPSSQPEKSVELDEEAYKNKIMKNIDDSPQCLLCHYLVSYLDAVLKTNKSQEAIDAALERVCKLLPAKERAQCEEMVKTYGPVLAELISEMADPDSVCRYLGLCQTLAVTGSTAKTPTLLGTGNHDYVHPNLQDTPFTCTICQFVITRMKNFIALNQTEEEILASLKGSCDLFSVIHLKEQCLDFLEKYGPYLIQMVSSDVDPKVACQSIDACEKSSPVLATERSQSSPSGKCVFGISYWCTSRQNAELCNAVELCERLVWSKKNKNIII